LEPNACSNSEIAVTNVAVVMALSFSHVDGEERAAGFPALARLWQMQLLYCFMETWIRGSGQSNILSVM
jgi:hypothetical protein